MIILAIDVTSPHGSVAVRADGATKAEVVLEATDGYGHILFPAISQVLEQAGVRLQEVDCIAGASGPGAFTGVRVGLGAIKGLAEALGRPVVGVSNLRAMSTFGHAAQRGVLLDARRGDVFAAVYTDQLELAGEETVGKLATWLAGLPPGVDEFIVQDAALLPGRAVTVAPLALAGAVALCAETSPWADAATLDANYVRRSDAELFWRET